MAEEISKDQALKTLAKGSGISFFGMVISQIILYLLRLVLARALTPGEYGLLFLGLSLINIAMTFVLLGVHGGIERYIPYYNAKKDYRRTRGIILSSLKISLPVSLFVFILVFIFADQIAVLFFHEPSLSPILRIFSFIVPFYAVYKIFAAVLIALKRVKYDVFSWHIGRSLTTLIAVLAFWTLGFGLIGATLSYTLGFVVSAVLSFVFMKRVFPHLKTTEKPIAMKEELLAFSLPLLFFNVLLDIMTRIDTLMLGALKTSFDVGIYQTALPTSQFLFVVPSTLGVLFVPVMSELFSKKKTDDIKKVYKTVAKWGFYINLPIFLLFFMYPNAVINTLFGPEYLSAGNSLRLLSFGYMIYFIGIISSMMLNVFEKTKYHVINTGVSLLAGVALNYILIPLYGLDGAALASTLMLMFYTLLVAAEVYVFSRNLPLHRDMIKSLFSGIVSIAIVYMTTKFFFASLNVWILAGMFIAFFALYSIILLFIRGFRNEDIMILKAIETKTGLKIKFLRSFMKRFI